MNAPFRLPPLLHLAGGLLLIVLVGAGLASRGPDFDVEFTRDIPSRISPKDLSAFFNTVDGWPMWFHQTGRAEVLGADASGQPTVPQSTLAVGHFVRLSIDPQKGPWRKYQLTTRVEAFEPGKLLQLRVENDQTGRLTRMFSSLSWRVELIPSTQTPTQTVVRGRVLARTAHWKSRLFGRVTPRILLYQVFFPNIVRLAEIDRPEPSNAFSTEPPKAPPQPIQSGHP